MTTDPAMDGSAPDETEIKFRIGDVFSASDPVARYVTGVAMISNDWGRLFQLQDELGERHPGPRLLLYRFQLALHVEAAKFIQQAQGQYPVEIGRFLAGLPDEAQKIHKTLVDPEHLAKVRADDTRNLSFHYPQIMKVRFERDIEEMAGLLKKAEDLTGRVEASSVPRFLEYQFADEVALQMLPMTPDEVLDEKAIAVFRERALAFRRFAELVLNQYVDGQPNDDLEETVDVEEEPDGRDRVG